MNGKDGVPDLQTTQSIAQKAVADTVSPRLNAMQQQINDNDRRASAGVASATAIASIPQAVDPGGRIMGAGAGCFNGQCSAALGISYRSQDGLWTSKASVGVNTNGTAVGVGVARSF